MRLRRRRPAGRRVSISTDAAFAAAPGDAWRAIVFYEEIEHRPPWLLRLALPRPLRSEGAKDAAGGIVRCTYESGYLLKRMTAVEEGRLLAFDVVEQHLDFGGGVELLGGGVSIDPLGSDRARVTLTTRYKRPWRPLDPVWAAIEERLVHGFHRHVLEGMRRSLARRGVRRGTPSEARPRSTVPSSRPTY
jgi:hypothetical protein